MIEEVRKYENSKLRVETELKKTTIIKFLIKKGFRQWKRDTKQVVSV